MHQQYSRSGHQAGAWSTVPAWPEPQSISEVQWPPAPAVPRREYASVYAARTVAPATRWPRWFVGLTLAFAGGIFARPYLETHVAARGAEWLGQARMVWSFVANSLPAWMQRGSALRDSVPSGPIAAPAPSIRPLEAAPQVRAPAPVVAPAVAPVIEPAAPLVEPTPVVHAAAVVSPNRARARASRPVASAAPQVVARGPAPAPIVSARPPVEAAPAVEAPVAEPPHPAPAPDSIDGLMARALHEPPVGTQASSAAARLRFPERHSVRPRRTALAQTSGASKPEHVALPEPEPQGPALVAPAKSATRIRLPRKVKVSDDPLAGVVARGSIEGQRTARRKNTGR